MNGRNKKTPVLVFLGILCLVLAGCSGGGGGGQTDATAHGTQPSVYMDTGVEMQADIPDISIESSGFSPQTFTTEYLAAGGSGGYTGGCNPCPQVIWVNNDDKPHTITSLDEGESSNPATMFRSPEIAPGSQWSWTFIQPGTYEYQSDSGEKGTIEVVEVTKE
tara:strand:+ start:420 stop:908 length:489 start_codon:yes stop_codon:yes gene_type:complete